MLNVIILSVVQYTQYRYSEFAMQSVVMLSAVMFNVLRIVKQNVNILGAVTKCVICYTVATLNVISLNAVR